MHKVLIYNNFKYPINKDSIATQIKKTLKNQKVKSDTIVHVSFVDDLAITRLHKKYLHLSGTTDVLSFPIDELKSNKSSRIRFTSPDNKTRLGDIIVCYPQAKRQAENSKVGVDEEINKLVEHGILHLLGIHHGE